MFESYLYQHQKRCLKALEKNDRKRNKRCLINQWCGTGKTRTFTLRTFMRKDLLTIIVFPSLGLVNQYNNDYIASKQQPFKDEFKPEATSVYGEIPSKFK